MREYDLCPTTRIDVREYDLDDHMSERCGQRWRQRSRHHLRRREGAVGPTKSDNMFDGDAIVNLFNIPIRLEYLLFHNRLQLIIKHAH